MQLLGLTNLCLTWSLLFVETEVRSPTSPQEWFQNEIVNLQKIRSLEFVAKRTQMPRQFRLPDDAPVDRAVTASQIAGSETMRFVANGVCIRVEYGDQNVVAYDGESFRTLRDGGTAFGERLGMPDGPIIPFPHPITWAYRWAFPPGTYGDLPALAETGMWEPLFDTAFEPTPGTIECSRINANGNGYTYELSVGADGHLAGWTGFKMPGRIREGVVTITGSTLVRDGEEQEIWIPTSVAYEANSEGTVTMMPDTLRVNHHIQPDEFLISRSEASRMLPEPDSLFADQTPTSRSTSKSAAMWLLLNILVIAIVAFGFYCRKRSTRK